MQIKEKSLPLAIGLNLLLPGLGYMYREPLLNGRQESHED